jgi:hypothetical protein
VDGEVFDPPEELEEPEEPVFESLELPPEDPPPEAPPAEDPPSEEPPPSDELFPAPDFFAESPAESPPDALFSEEAASLSEDAAFL